VDGKLSKADKTYLIQREKQMRKGKRREKRILFQASKGDSLNGLKEREKKRLGRCGGDRPHKNL